MSLEAEDIREAIHFAAEAVPEREPSLASFRERLRASIKRNDEILDRLAR